MSVYELKSNKPITFTDHTGVSFIKNLVEAILGPEDNPDVQFNQNCGIEWTCTANGGVASVGGGSLILSAEPGFGVTVFTPNSFTNGTVLRVDIDIVSLDGDSKIDFYPGNNSNLITFNTTGQQFAEVVVDGSNYALYNTGLFDNSKLAVINSLSIREVITAESSDEIATGATSTYETSPSQVLTFNDVIWIAEPIRGDTVSFRYNSGNYQDSNGRPVNAQTFNLINCLDPTIGATNLNVTFVNSSDVSLAWTVAPSFAGMADYKLYRNNVFITNISLFDNTYFDTALNPSTNYNYRLESFFGTDLISSVSVNAFTLAGAQNLFVPLDDTSFLTADNLLLNHNGA